MRKQLCRLIMMLSLVGMVIASIADGEEADKWLIEISQKTMNRLNKMESK